MDRRQFLMRAAALGALALCACSENAWRYGNTIGMWKDNTHRYQENVDSVLVSQDGSLLVFLGPDYHYIFEAPPALVGVLRTPALHGLIRGDLGVFRVDRDGKVSGRVELVCDHQGDDPALDAQFKALGFEYAYGRWQFVGHLGGTRYAANGFKLPAGTQNGAQTLSHPYTVDVIEPDSALRTAGKVLATPVAVGADGVIVVGAAAASIVLIPVAAVFLTVFFIMVKHDNHS